MTLADRLRSVLSDPRERGSDGDETGDETQSDPARAEPADSAPVPETTLFECATCDTVYVAVDKSTCSTCGSEVEEVSATLSSESEARSDSKRERRTE